MVTDSCTIREHIDKIIRYHAFAQSNLNSQYIEIAQNLRVLHGLKISSLGYGLEVVLESSAGSDLKFYIT